MDKPANFPRLREYRKAKNFLNDLRLTNDEWSVGKQWHSEWVFRGQSNANWLLMPSAWRKIKQGDYNSQAINFIKHQKEFDGNHNMAAWESALAYQWEVSGISRDDELAQRRWENTLKVIHQVYAEIRAIHSFSHRASELGYVIDSFEGDIHMSNYLADMYREGQQNNNIWMSDIVALVQHHNIPTRLLDWTTQPLIAAFFAAESVDIASPTTRDKIAVFAYKTSTTRQSRIKIKRLPRSKSPYLHAQSGLFTYDSEGDSWYIQHGIWPSFEDAHLKESELRDRDSLAWGTWELDRLIKFTLPASEAGEILRLLWLEGISRAHLMPTLDNVANSLKKQMYWAEQQNPKRINRLLED